MRWQTDPLLVVENLTMRFGGLVAVDDLSFTAGRGDITAIIGPNGAGKTTLFNCLTGFYKPTTGTLRLAHPTRGEIRLEALASHLVARDAQVVRTFQNIRLFPKMTVLENLIVAQHNVLQRASKLSIAGIFKLPGYREAEKQAIERAAMWLERLKLTHLADDAAGDLPYGIQRRIEIARALCVDPVLLCLDEPAAGLNPRESAELNDLLTSIRDRDGIGVLLIEQERGRHLEIAHAVRFRSREPVGADVHLDRRQQQRRRRQRGVALHAGSHEFLLGLARAHMHVAFALVAHRGFPCIGVAARRLVVVAHE